MKVNTIIPTDEEDAAINAGIAVDNNTYELSNEGFTTLKPMGRPKPASIKNLLAFACHLK